MNTQLTNVISIFGASDEKELRSILNPDADKITNHILLDTKYRLVDEDPGSNLDHFTFYYSMDKNNSPGAVTTNIPLENIVSMKMYKTRIPYPAVMTPISYKISAAIKEFTAQSYIMPSGFRAHWIFGAVKIRNSTMIDAVIENYNDGIFNFSKPITVVNSMTLIFGDPLYQNIFWNDRGKCTFNGQWITTILPHNFDTTVSGSTYVTFLDFNTADPVKDKDIIDNMNTNSYTATIASPNLLNLTGISLASITALPLDTQFTIYYSERRIYMPIEFTMKKKEKESI